MVKPNPNQKAQKVPPCLLGLPPKLTLTSICLRIVLYFPVLVVSRESITAICVSFPQGGLTKWTIST